MRKVYFLLLIVFSLIVVVNAQNKSINSQLRDIKKIYVTELGTTDKSDIIRNKIQLRLVKTGKFTIVDRREDADAVLTGTVVMEKYVDVSDNDVNTKTNGVGVFYLRRATDDQIVWTYEYKSKFFDFAIFTDRVVRAYDQVAERTVDRLMKDAGYKK